MLSNVKLAGGKSQTTSNQQPYVMYANKLVGIHRMITCFCLIYNYHAYCKGVGWYYTFNHVDTCFCLLCFRIYLAMVFLLFFIFISVPRGTTIFVYFFSRLLIYNCHVYCVSRKKKYHAHCEADIYIPRLTKKI